jgi:hypothetical protein
MDPVGKSKVSKLTPKEGVVYPFIRLPPIYENLIGNTVTIYETEHNGQRALLLVPYDDTTNPPKIERLDSKVSIDKRLSSIETDLKEIKEILKVM